MRVSDVLQPLEHLSVHPFRQGDVAHAGGGKGPVPMLHAGRDAHHVAGVDLLDRATHCCTRPAPAVTISVCPSGCVCRPCGPGFEVTSPPDMREGGASLSIGSTGPSR